MIDVSDIYDAFFDVAKAIWDRCEYKNTDWRDASFVGPPLSDLLDYLEEKVFLSACARRYQSRHGRKVTTMELLKLLRVVDASGVPLAGIVSRYHSYGFDWFLSDDIAPVLENCVIAGDSLPRKRSDVRLVMIDSDEQ
jgi:hypothetical protein